VSALRSRFVLPSLGQPSGTDVRGQDLDEPAHPSELQPARHRLRCVEDGVVLESYGLVTGGEYN